MDPNEALKRARIASAKWRKANFNSTEELAAGMELADSFEALDDWFSRGGFPPKDWSKK